MCTSRPDPTVDDAAALLRTGHVVAYPTDTLYALGALATSETGVATVLRIKERVPDKTLPLIAADIAQVEWLAGPLSPRVRHLASRWWPGPLTLVLDVQQTLAPGVVAPDGSVAVRVPAHALARDLARRAGGALTSTSANRAGQPPATTAEACLSLGEDVALVLDGGPSRATRPSTIVDVRGTDLRLLREGAVPWDHVLHSTR